MIGPNYERPDASFKDWPLASRLLDGDILAPKELTQFGAELRWFGRNSGPLEALHHLSRFGHVDPFEWQGDYNNLRRLRAMLATLLVEAVDFGSALVLLSADFGIEEVDFEADIESLQKKLSDVPSRVCQEAMRAIGVLAGAYGYLYLSSQIFKSLLAHENPSEQIETQIRRVELAIDSGELEQARSLLAQLATLKSQIYTLTDEIEVRLQLLTADTNAQEGRYSEAKAIYRSLLESKRSEIARRRLIDTHLELKQLDQAESLIENAAADSWIEVTRFRKLLIASHSSRRSSSTMDILAAPETHLTSMMDNPVDLFTDVMHYAKTVTQRRSPRLRADLEQACYIAELCAIVGKENHATSILTACELMAKPAASPLFDGFIKKASARSLIEMSAPRLLEGRQTAETAIADFRSAGHVAMEVATEELIADIDLRLSRPLLAAPHKEAFLQNLDHQDRLTLQSTNWTSWDDKISELVGNGAPEPDAISTALGLAQGLNKPIQVATRRLSKNSAVLAYFTTQDTVYPVIALPDATWSMVGDPLPVTRQALIAGVEASLRVINRPGSGRGPQLSQTLTILRDMLGLGAVVAQIESADITRLQILSTGLISQAPLCAIPVDNDRRLVDAVVLTTALTTQPIPKSKKIGSEWLALSNEAGQEDAKLDVLHGIDKLVPKVFVDHPDITHLPSEEANRANFIEAIHGKSGVVTICHGRGAGDGKDPGLLFHDGWINADEIAAVKIEAEAVIVAGCWGHADRTLEAGHPGSIARAFTEAGARNVIASLWTQRQADVEPMLNALLANDVLRHPADALAEYQRKKSQANAPPSTWAGLVCVTPGVQSKEESLFEKISRAIFPST